MSKGYESSVVWFVQYMFNKLRQNEHKKHWRELSEDWLLEALNSEVGELSFALSSGDKDDIIYECADVANFAMMIADKQREKK